MRCRCRVSAPLLASLLVAPSAPWKSRPADTNVAPLEELRSLLPPLPEVVEVQRSEWSPHSVSVSAALPPAPRRMAERNTGREATTTRCIYDAELSFSLFSAFARDQDRVKDKGVSVRSYLLVSVNPPRSFFHGVQWISEKGRKKERMEKESNTHCCSNTTQAQLLRENAIEIKTTRVTHFQKSLCSAKAILLSS